ncbi:MAG: hypothetical protein HY941_05290 [Gammaproteobacteria bacterium]|nr:hypothetical protein [Gammaproteobacteria bacterium]
MTLHTQIGEQLVTEFGERLADLPHATHDALDVRFDTGLALQIRYPNLDEYSLRWSYRERTLGIDTAPLHAEIDSFPNHLHDHDGQIRADRHTRPGRPAWDNLRPLIAALLLDPWLNNASSD